MLTYLEQGWGYQFAKAFAMSFSIAAISFVLSIIIGVAATLLAASTVRLGAAAVKFYTYLFRSLPGILLLLLIFYTADSLIQSVVQLLTGEPNASVSPVVPAVLSTSVVLGAYATELFKSGWADIPSGQHEAGRALGFTRVQSIALIILPQVYRKVLPHLGSLWLISMKETALLSIIGIPDIVRIASLGARSTGAPFTFFGIAIAIFIAFAFASSRAFSYLEGRSRRAMGAI